MSLTRVAAPPKPAGGPAPGTAAGSRRASLHRLLVLPAALLLGLAGCGHLGTPSTITLSEADLQRLMTGQFPLEQRLLEVFEVRATAPQLRLLPERGRLQMVLALEARERIMASRYSGRLDFDTGLRWDAAEHAVRLDQVRVKDFVLDPASAAPPATTAFNDTRRSGAQRLATALAERVLEGLVLYRLPADKRAQLDQAGVQPAALAVTRSGLEISFAPKPK